MKKIAIVTLSGDYNYGNRFQNYAVQEIVKRKGFDVETVINIDSVPERLIRFFYKYITAFFGDYESRRNTGMMRFTRKRISHVNVLGRGIPARLTKRYDYFVVGSDQVWNPKLKEFNYQRFFLRFCDKSKRVCMSPSIGLDSLPEKYIELFREGLSGFEHLSCREEKGSQLIRQLTGRECETLIDPTLALTAEEWRKIEQERQVPEKYILLFLLGEKSDVVKDILAKADSDCTVIDVGDKKSAYHAVTPEELLYLIDHAKLVITDSFHLTAFSINFNVPFYVVDRFDSKNETNNQMNSRIISLTGMCGLEDRYITGLVDQIDFDCDFTSANRELPEQRMKLEKYLEECLG